jgi:predicted RNA-binding protein
VCLATVYIEHDGQQEKVMQDVAWIRPESHGLQLITLLGESKLFEASIKSIDLVKGSIVLEMNASD